MWQDTNNPVGYWKVSGMIEEMLGEPTRADAELDWLFTNKKDLTGDTIINASFGQSDHGLIQFKILRGLRKASRTLQTGLKPRVNHPWSTWFLSVIKWLDLWTQTDVIYLSWSKAFKTGSQKILAPKLENYSLDGLTTSWVKNCCWDDGAQKETVNRLYSTYRLVRIGVLQSL